jgi:uncharacterized integral membrane protein
VPLRRKVDSTELRETWQPKLWLLLGGLVLLGAYLVGFITKNSDEVDVHFVLGSARVSLIWVILLSLAIGVLAGLLVSQLYRRRTATRSTRPVAAPPPESPPG